MILKFQKNEEIVKFLLENTAIKVNETNSSGYKPLDIAASSKNNNENIVNLLIKHNANSDHPVVNC